MCSSPRIIGHLHIRATVYEVINSTFNHRSFKKKKLFSAQARADFPFTRNGICSVYGRHKDNSTVWDCISSRHVQYFEPRICATQLLYTTATGCHGTLNTMAFPFFAANSALTPKSHQTKLRGTRGVPSVPVLVPFPRCSAHPGAEVQFHRS